MRGHRCCLVLVTLALVLWRAEMTQAGGSAEPEQKSGDSSSIPSASSDHTGQTVDPVTGADSCTKPLTQGGQSDPESQACDTRDTHSYKRSQVKDKLTAFEELLEILGPDAYLLHDDSGEVIGVAKDRESSQGDSDVCCTTSVRYYANATLTDVFGTEKTIAQKEQVGAYQLIRHGRCSESNQCMGTCTELLVSISLAIYPPEENEITSFSFFEVPGYCICQVEA